MCKFAQAYPVAYQLGPHQPVTYALEVRRHAHTYTHTHHMHMPFIFLTLHSLPSSFPPLLSPSPSPPIPIPSYPPPLLPPFHFLNLLQGAVSIAGQSVRWLRDNLEFFSDGSDIGKPTTVLYGIDQLSPHKIRSFFFFFFCWCCVCPFILPIIPFSQDVTQKLLNALFWWKTFTQ